MNIAYEDLRALTKLLHEALQEVVVNAQKLLALDAEIRDLKRQLQVLRSQHAHLNGASLVTEHGEDS